MTNTPRPEIIPAGVKVEARHGSAVHTAPQPDPAPAAHGPLVRALFSFSFLALSGLLLAGLYNGGFFARVHDYAAPRLDRYFYNAGINVQKIVVRGQVNLKDTDILEALGISTGQSLFGFDAAEAQKRLTDLHMVRKARVMRLLPSTLLVEVAERAPFARWQHDGRIDLVDTEGVVLTGAANADTSSFPLVSGDGAGAAAEGLIRLLTAHEQLAENVAMARFAPGNRWEFVARSGAVVKLPAGNIGLALARFVRLPGWRDLLQQKGAVIDMRLPDRAFVRKQEAGPKTTASSG